MHQGYVQIAERALPDFSGMGAVLRHAATGAEVVLVQNNDPELVFAISLRTHPTRDDGIAHVLEHLIFRGSRRFPQTNLYSGLMQGTGATGLNASTKADHTMFHFSTAGEDDFATLTDIMLDAVFDPLLADPDIAQERAIVMNEMAGHHAIPANRITEGLRQRMFPRSVHAVDFGGCPVQIATLTADRLRRFHARHYHPGNAQIFLWGHIDPASRLDQLDMLLQTYPARAAEQMQPLPADAAQQDVTGSYPGDPGGPRLTGMGWVCDTDQHDLWQAASLHLLAAPEGLLRQGLQSKGHRLLGRGFTQDTPLATFEIALAGAGSAAPSWLLSETEKTVTTLAPEWEREAIRRFALTLSRLGTGCRGPSGLRAFDLMADGWRQGREPLALLDIRARIDAVEKVIKDDPGAMIRRITQDLLDTPYRASVVLTPEATTANQPTLPHPMTQQPDPRLNAPSLLPSTANPDITSRSGEIVSDDVNGILSVHVPGPPLARAELALSLAGLTMGDVKRVPVLLAVLRQLPLFPDLSLRCWTNGTARSPLYLSIAGVALPAEEQNLLEALQSPLHQPLPDAGQLHPILMQARATLRSRIAGFGHLHCDTRLRAAEGTGNLVDEWVNGISQLDAFDDALAQTPDALWRSLSALRDKVAQRSVSTLAVSGIDPDLAPILPVQTPPSLLDNGTQDFPRSEAVVTDAGNFTTGQALKLSDPGAAIIAAHMLEFGWLWDAVRVAGGAYSVRATFDPCDGLLRMISIRDPSAMVTLNQFRKAPLWLHHNAVGDLVDRCRSAAMGRMLRPVRPDDMLSTALRRHLSGETADTRQERLSRLGAVGATHMRQLADEFHAGLSKARTVVLGPQAGLAAIITSCDGMVMRN